MFAQPLDSSLAKEMRVRLLAPGRVGLSLDF